MHTRKSFSQDAHLYPSTGQQPLKSKVPGIQPGYENATTRVTELVCVFMASLHIFEIQKTKQTKSIKDLTFPCLQET